MGVTPQSYLRSAVADSIIGLHASVLINRAVKNYRFSQIMIEKTQKNAFFDLMIVNPPNSTDVSQAKLLLIDSYDFGMVVMLVVGR
jgi:hypothetical protein